jgi:hypothetical protein
MAAVWVTKNTKNRVARNPSYTSPMRVAAGANSP